MKSLPGTNLSAVEALDRVRNARVALGRVAAELDDLKAHLGMDSNYRSQFAEAIESVEEADLALSNIDTPLLWIASRHLPSPAIIGGLLSTPVPPPPRGHCYQPA